jgi:glutaredoxin
MKKIDVYYAPVCTLCTESIDFLRSRGLSFTAHAVEWHAPSDAFVDTPVSQEMHRRCAQTVDFVPQIFIGDTHIAGWRKLEPMIKSGEFDRLLEA